MLKFYIFAFRDVSLKRQTRAGRSHPFVSIAQRGGREFGRESRPARDNRHVITAVVIGRVGWPRLRVRLR
jgi:hypothetical protein